MTPDTSRLALQADRTPPPSANSQTAQPRGHIPGSPAPLGEMLLPHYLSGWELELQSTARRLRNLCTSKNSTRIRGEKCQKCGWSSAENSSGPRAGPSTMSDWNVSQRHSQSRVEVTVMAAKRGEHAEKHTPFQYPSSCRPHLPWLFLDFTRYKTTGPRRGTKTVLSAIKPGTENVQRTQSAEKACGRLRWSRTAR